MCEGHTISRLKEQRCPSRVDDEVKQRRGPRGEVNVAP